MTTWDWKGRHEHEACETGRRVCGDSQDHPRGPARAFEAVNVALIDTYWAVGAHLSRKVSEAGWGKGIVKELATWLAAQVPDLKGFSSSNLWRMKQFYEVYQMTKISHHWCDNCPGRTT